MAAVRVHEASAGRRFHYIARLRFDLTMGAPLPSTLLRQDRAFLAFPPAARAFQRTVPLPDHMWITPREHAESVLDVMSRYARCRGADGGAGSASPASNMSAAKVSKAAVAESCRQTQLCQYDGGVGAHEGAHSINGASASASGAEPSRPLPPLCCGRGPTGVVVRALQRAERESRGRLTVVLFEHPMLLIGRLWTAAKLCTYKEAASQLGYFRNRNDCVLISSACAATP